MTPCKLGIGFHVGVPAYLDGIGDYYRALAAGGHTIFAKGADSAGVIYEAAQIAVQSGAEFYGVWRKTEFSWGNDVPDYKTAPESLSKKYFAEILDVWPKELDRRAIYVEFPNEPDKNNADYVGWLAYHAGRGAIARGMRYCAPAWSAGEPEPEHWKLPGWQAYLKLAAANPDRLAVSLHEYTLSPEGHVLEAWPWLIGRVTLLNEACREMGIQPPIVFLTEWGWGANEAPPAWDAVVQIIEAVTRYLTTAPNVKGLAIWALDSGWQWKSLSRTVNSYMAPLAAAVGQTHWPEPRVETPPMENGRHKAVVWLAAQEHTADEYAALAGRAHQEYKRTVTASADDALTMVKAGNDESYIVVFDPDLPSQLAAQALFSKAGANWETRDLRPAPKPPAPGFRFERWPTLYRYITQPFAANPDNYAQFGLPGHEGIDIRAPYNSPYYAVAPGRVVRVSDKRSDGSDSAYGWHVIVEHPSGHTTLYAHARPDVKVKEGDEVAAGALLAYSGNTGNSSGPHLHLTLKHPDRALPGWPKGYMDPTPFLDPIMFVPPKAPRARGFVWAAGLVKRGHLALAQTTLNLRELPSKGSNLIRRVEPGEPVYILSQQGQNGYLLIEAHAPDGREQVDMAPYFMPPNGRLTGDWVKLDNNWGQGSEWVQLQIDGNNSYIVKNQQWEKRRIDDARIYLEMDTSPGDGRFYTVQSLTGWLPRYWSTGQSFKRQEVVNFYIKESCKQVGDTWVNESFIRFSGLHTTWTSKAGITCANVIELAWEHLGHTEETYFYAPGLGLVGWRNRAGRESWVSAIQPASWAPPATREVINCI